MMKEVLKDNKGQAIVEAIIYFPFIVLLVVVMVIIGMYKIDKMLAQACMSERMDMVQSSIDSNDKNERIQYWSPELINSNLEYYSENSILKWDNPREKQYIVVNCTAILSPILQVDYENENTNGNLLGLIRGNRTTSTLLINNPFDLTYTVDDLRLFYTMTSFGNVITGKTGYTYEQYLDAQFGVNRRR